MLRTKRARRHRITVRNWRRKHSKGGMTYRLLPNGRYEWRKKKTQEERRMIAIENGQMIIKRNLKKKVE